MKRGVEDSRAIIGIILRLEGTPLIQEQLGSARLHRDIVGTSADNRDFPMTVLLPSLANAGSENVEDAPRRIFISTLGGWARLFTTVDLALPTAGFLLTNFTASE